MRSSVILPPRVVAVVAVWAVSAPAIGCAERGGEPATVNDVAKAPARACGAPVTTLTAPIEPVAVVVPPRAGVRLQQTVSLGYAGDGPLTQIESHREWWGDRDSAYPAYGGYGYGYGDGYGGGRGPVRGRGAPQSSSGRSMAHGSPPFQQGMATRGGGSSAPASPPSAHGPR